MKAWHITDWDALYEVNDKGGRWKPGEKKKARAPEYVRWYVGGPDGDNQAYQECAAAVSGKFPEGSWTIAFAVFGKLLELAARPKPPFRGFLVGKGNSPCTPGIISYLTFFTQAQVELGLSILSDPLVGWIELADLPENSGDSGKIPATPESLLETETETKAEAETKTEGDHQGKVPDPAPTPQGNGSEVLSPDGFGSGRLGKATATKPASCKSPAPSREFQLGQLQESQTATDIAHALRLSPQGPQRDSPDYVQRQADLEAIAGIARKTRSWLSLPDTLQKARQIADDPKIKNRIACLVAWVKRCEQKELAKK